VRADEYLKTGDIDQALKVLQDEVRAEPAKPQLRVFLFQLLSVMGNWERAMTQLNVVAELNPEAGLQAEMYRPALNCEALRTAIFAGGRSPLIFGEPEEWVGWLAQALVLLGEGKTGAAQELRARAYEAAPAIAGKINGEPFEWIADADSRLGPVLEAIINGKYYWVPFSCIRAITIDAPKELRDTIWITSYLTWTNEGRAAALIPVRYAGSETSEDNLCRLARKTEWVDAGGDCFQGVGQRMLATDQGEYPLLEIREIVFE
jgi:type VI secretion system protein ImpE